VPAFKQVFSTTGKTVVSLLLISLGIGIVWAIVYGVSNRSVSSSADSFEETQADEASTKMPKSQWDAKVNAAIAAHCIFEGMTRSQVEEALGKIDVEGTSESYKHQGDTCRKYNGDTCVESDTQIMWLDFTKNGNYKEPSWLGGIRSTSASVDGVPMACLAPSWTMDPPKTKDQTKDGHTTRVDSGEHEPK
jgi:hypothetical protein